MESEIDSLTILNLSNKESCVLFKTLITLSLGLGERNVSLLKSQQSS